MKKIITLALILSMLALLIVPSFADSTEEEKILEAAKKGAILYDVVSYFPPLIIASMQHHESEYKGQGIDDTYDFMHSLIPDRRDRTVFEFSKEEYFPDRDDITRDCEYVKLGDLVNSSDDVKNLVDKYLFGFSGTIDTEETLERDENGCAKRHPLLRTIDGELYTIGVNGIFSLDFPFLFFEKFSIVSYDNKNAVVNAVVDEDYMYDGDELQYENYTIELKKKNGQWKVCGGTLFSEFYKKYNIPYHFAPRTGEDFSLITHTLVIGVCAALMLVLSKRRKLEI